MKLPSRVVSGYWLGWLVVACIGLLTTSESIFAASPGETELSDLRSAPRGDLSNVFVVRMFAGYVAFPRQQFSS